MYDNEAVCTAAASGIVMQFQGNGQPHPGGYRPRSDKPDFYTGGAGGAGGPGGKPHYMNKPGGGPPSIPPFNPNGFGGPKPMYGNGPNGANAGGAPGGGGFNKFRSNNFGGPGGVGMGGGMIPKKDFGGPKLYGGPSFPGNGNPRFDKPMDSFGGPKKYNPMPNSYGGGMRNSYGPKPDYNNLTKEDRAKVQSLKAKISEIRERLGNRSS